MFSYVRKIKIDQRARMGDNLFEALVICWYSPGSAIGRHSTPDMLKFLKGSCMRVIGKEADTVTTTFLRTMAIRLFKPLQ